MLTKFNQKKDKGSRTRIAIAHILALHCYFGDKATRYLSPFSGKSLKFSDFGDCILGGLANLVHPTSQPSCIEKPLIWRLQYDLVVKYNFPVFGSRDL